MLSLRDVDDRIKGSNAGPSRIRDVQCKHIALPEFDSRIQLPGAFEQFKQWNKPPEIIPRRRGEAACFGYGLYIARLEDDDPTLAQYKSGALGKPAT